MQLFDATAVSSEQQTEAAVHTDSPELDSDVGSFLAHFGPRCTHRGFFLSITGYPSVIADHVHLLMAASSRTMYRLTKNTLFKVILEISKAWKCQVVDDVILPEGPQTSLSSTDYGNKWPLL